MPHVPCIGAWQGWFAANFAIASARGDNNDMTTAGLVLMESKWQMGEQSLFQRTPYVPVVIGKHMQSV